ncbi:MAG TPA: selenide, water dikinase SelD [Streptosporangiaceae bacterium]|nr:selenide, water dikinase SelD [Streptosporangiaceae bacterium]
MKTSINADVRLTSLSPGAGCACKLPLASLEELFASLGPLTQPLGNDLLVGLADGDDAAVYRLDDERALILTTDFFTPIVDSPFDWGRVSATNALSDVYAMGGQPLLALNLAAWPNADLPIEMLGEVMRGAAKAAKEAGCAVVGGHTIDDPVPKYGMAVVGLAHPDRLLSIDQATTGDELVLTKPIGTGVIATAIKRGNPRPEAVRASIEAMTTLNAAASQAALDAGVRAVTDVTGFGLLGHLHRMARASGVAAEVFADRVPLLPDARELVAEGYVSGGTRANITHLRDMVLVEPGVDEELSVLLHDAQTSGGLLMCAPTPTDRLLDDLRDRGVAATVIGRIVDGGHGRVTVR